MTCYGMVVFYCNVMAIDKGLECKVFKNGANFKRCNDNKYYT